MYFSHLIHEKVYIIFNFNIEVYFQISLWVIQNMETIYIKSEPVGDKDILTDTLVKGSMKVSAKHCNLVSSSFISLLGVL